MEETKDGKACCDKTKCCGGKALLALLLVGAGFAGGYFTSKCCQAKQMEAAKQAATAPIAAPQN